MRARLELALQPSLPLVVLFLVNLYLVLFLVGRFFRLPLAGFSD